MSPNRLDPTLGRRDYAVAAAVIFSFVVLAAVLRWDQDDAFISYRYARHLLEGKGLVWNPGYAVEGYTNFLWVLALAGLASFGIEIPTASHVLGLTAFAASLFAVLWLAYRLFGSKQRALAALVLVASNYSFLSYATGGLETSMNTMWGLWLMLLTVSAYRANRFGAGALALASLLMALLVMTRPDSIVLCLVAGSTAAWLALREPGTMGSKGLRLLALSGPAVVLVGTWLRWKLVFYGDILPNTFHVKMGVTSALTYVRGVAYLALFFGSFWMLPALAVSLWGALRAFRGAFRIVATYVVLWFLYVIRTGGDIMEFRQLVPAIPFIVLLLMQGVFETLESPKAQIAILALLPIGSLCHGLFFPKYVTPPGISSVPELSGSVSRNWSVSWSAIGVALREAFPDPERGPVIAVSPAGAIPFYSDLPTIDVVGLNDRWVARNGTLRKLCRPCTAHPRLAPIAYLKQSNVALLIGHPQLVSLSKPSLDVHKIVERMFYEEAMDYANIPPSARLVLIPIADGRALAALMLTPHAAVDEAINRHGWRVSLPWANDSSSHGGA